MCSWSQFVLLPLFSVLLQAAMTNAQTPRIALLVPHTSLQDDLGLLKRIEVEMLRRQMFTQFDQLHSKHREHSVTEKKPRSKRDKRLNKDTNDSSKRYSRIGGSIIMGKRR